ncbi:unnamed protein product [Linum trigynum]|uniref:Uncharacterized protein n=1 Tax=Linum trigynum TaxID=586398 RepID=A0AAV2CV94_9ROSI
MWVVVRRCDDLNLVAINEIDDDGRSIATARLVTYVEMTGVKYWAMRFSGLCDGVAEEICRRWRKLQGCHLGAIEKEKYFSLCLFGSRRNFLFLSLSLSQSMK